jgi:hypothetical protein
MDAPDPRTELVYNESVRALQVQSSSLDDLRSRTGILLAALALTASFLGARALDVSGFTTWSWIAVGCFGGSGICCLLILFPWGEWHFTHDANKVIQEFMEEEDEANLDEMHREIAETNQKNWTNNNSKLAPLFWLFRLAVLLLVLQVGFWLISLGNSGASTETSKKTSETSVRWNESEKEGQQWQSELGWKGQRWAARYVSGRNAEEGLTGRLLLLPPG